MRTPISVRELTTEERAALEAGLRSANTFTLRRCQILLANADGQPAYTIARNLQCNDQTVRNAIHAFNARGVAAVEPGSTVPHTVPHAVFAVDPEYITYRQSILEKLRLSAGTSGRLGHQ